MAVDPRAPTRGERLTAKLSEPPASEPAPAPSPPHAEWTTPVIGAYALVGIALSCLTFLGAWQYIESIDEKEQVARFGDIEEQLSRQHAAIERLTADNDRLAKHLLELGAPQSGDALRQAGVTSGFRLLVNGEELTLEEVARRLGPTAPEASGQEPPPSADPESE